MSSFRDRKNASGRDSKNVRDFASSDLCVSLGLSQTSYYALTRFGKGISLTFHLLVRALTLERTVIGRPPSQCCQMHDNNTPKTIILSIWCDTFSIAGEGTGSSACEKYVKTSSLGRGHLYAIHYHALSAR